MDQHLRRGAFMQVKQLLEQQHPGMEVGGSMYPVPPLKQGLAQVVGLGQMGAFAVVLFGDKIFEMLGYAAPPQLYVQYVQQNRFGAGVAAWFVGNLLQSQLMSTGAFEVYYDGSLVFSKLATGRMPAADEVLGPIEAQRAAYVRGSDAQTAADHHGHAVIQ
eukprot:gene12919-13046_t